MGILNIDLNNINLDNNFDEGDPDTIILIRLLLWNIKLKKHKVLKKEISEELMPIAWHPKGWWNFWISEDEKKKFNQFLLSNGFNVYDLKVLEQFTTYIVQKSLRTSSHFDIVQIFFLAWFFWDKCSKI